MPGFGLTGPFPDHDYRIEHYTRFIGDLLDQLGVKHAVLVGNSLGGRIAWQTALARRDLAERLVLIGAASTLNRPAQVNTSGEFSHAWP